MLLSACGLGPRRGFGSSVYYSPGSNPHIPNPSAPDPIPFFLLLPCSITYAGLTCAGGLPTFAAAPTCAGNFKTSFQHSGYCKVFYNCFVATSVYGTRVLLALALDRFGLLGVVISGSAKFLVTFSWNLVLAKYHIGISSCLFAHCTCMKCIEFASPIGGDLEIGCLLVEFLQQEFGEY